MAEKMAVMKWGTQSASQGMRGEEKEGRHNQSE